MSNPVNKNHPARVLVIRVGRLGDIVMSTNIIEPIRRTFGDDVEIDWAGGTGSANVVLEKDPRINRVFPIAHRRIPWPFHAVKRELRKRSRERPYDLAINLEFSPWCDDFAGFIKCRSFVGRPLANPSHQPGQHTVDAEKRLYGEALRVDVDGIDGPLLQLAPDTELKMLPPETPFVMINPGFSGVTGKGYHVHRGWPIKHWQSLIKIITRDIGMAVVINGSPDEGDYFKPLLGQPGVHSLFGSSIPELVHAVRKARCLVSVDTGTMHLGAALGTPTVALFGPSRPDLTGPFLAASPGKVLSSGIHCQPCWGTNLQKTCPFNRCMDELLPETVSGTLQELINN